MTSQEITQALRQAMDDVDAAMRFLREQVPAAANLDHAYRLARARAHVQAGTELGKGAKVADKEAFVIEAAAEERLAAKVAAGMLAAARENVRAKRDKLGAWQTIAAMHRAEAELARTGPQVTP